MPPVPHIFMEITVSIAQMNIAAGDIASNLERGRSLIAEAAGRGSDLVCFPEMWTTGLGNIDRYEAAECEKARQVISEEAARHALWISSPMLEVLPDGSRCNTSFLFAPDGRLAGAYRKIHLFSPFGEERSTKAGNALCTVDTPWGVSGLSICYDLRFPEMFRAYALRGAVLQICSAAFPHPRREHWQVLTRARAIENQFFMLAVNRAGSEDLGRQGRVSFFGASAVIDPWGSVIAEAEEEECLLTARIDTEVCEQARAAIPVAPDRRPDIYKR